jgi:hypothetical protein
MRLKNILLALTLGAACMLPATPHAYFLVANFKDELKSLSGRDLLLIFSMRRDRWSDGTPIQLVILPDNNYLHQQFAQQVLGIRYNQLRLIWDMQGYSGKRNIPIVVKDKAEMIERLRSIHGSLGYIYSNHIPGLAIRELGTDENTHEN